MLFNLSGGGGVGSVESKCWNDCEIVKYQVRAFQLIL